MGALAGYDAKTLDEEKAVAGRLNKAALDHVVHAPLGWYLMYHAWRKNVSGIAGAPLPFFWGVSKAV
jgi:peptide/nickel transport system substrate-binding protein